MQLYKHKYMLFQQIIENKNNLYMIFFGFFLLMLFVLFFRHLLAFFKIIIYII